VTICEHLDGTVSVRWGPHVVGRFDAEGRPIEITCSFGRPLEFYTDKASHFNTTRKGKPDPEEDPPDPTQIQRALVELNVGWIGANSPR
jgi:hypothetical protein